MQPFIGRKEEKAILDEALASSSPELVAIFGRRRVGKTFLVRQVYAKNLIFEFSGIKKASTSKQLERFTLALAHAFQLPFQPAVPTSWLHAFSMLSDLLERNNARSRRKSVVFLDEFPWLDSPRSGFLSAFDHFWNSWASKQDNLVVVICGSAASWMIQNVVRNKGGLHNRLTRRIRLMPFNLHETELFMQSHQIPFKRYQILQVYMAMGGIPHYLKEIRKGESVEQAIDRICFSPDGLLREEFQDLYPALFDQPDRHVSVVRALVNKPSGLTRNQLLAACKLTSGGSTTKLFDELLESGFVQQYVPFGKTSKDLVYKLSDEYSVFYLKFIENAKKVSSGTWQHQLSSQSYRIWSGFAFENICLKHIEQIKSALGISGVYAEHSVWRAAGDQSVAGAQIDLVLDRADRVINLFEIKFAATEFVIDKQYAATLDSKVQAFAAKANTTKALFLTLLTTFGAKKNQYYFSAVQRELTMDALFEH